jgi:hypothetical protein
LAWRVAWSGFVWSSDGSQFAANNGIGVGESVPAEHVDMFMAHGNSLASPSGFTSSLAKRYRRSGRAISVDELQVSMLRMNV